MLVTTKISELINNLKLIMITKGNLDVVIHNNGSLGDVLIMLENESLSVRDNILYIE